MEQDPTASTLENAEGRLLRWMAAIAVLTVAVMLASGRLRFAAGFLLGAGLAMLGFTWLRAAVAAVLSAGEQRPSKRILLRVIIRYPLALGLTYVFYRTRWLPFASVLAGFFTPAAGVLVECGWQLCSGW
jgi:hypothetical protein